MKKITLTLGVLLLSIGFLFAQTNQSSKSDTTKKGKAHRAKFSGSKTDDKKDTTKIRKRTAKF